MADDNTSLPHLIAVEFPCGYYRYKDNRAPAWNVLKPHPYIKTWLISGKRRAVEVNCSKRLKTNEETYKSIWLCLGK